MSKTVAILQNQVGIDGRSRTIAELIALLNSKGIVPTLLTFSDKRTISIFSTAFTREPLHFHYVRLAPLPISVGYSYQVLFSNLIARRELCKYEVVFNSNSFMLFLPGGSIYVHYIHFPLALSFDYEEKFRLPLLWLYAWPIRLLSKFEVCNINENAIIIANSTFTRSKAAQWYHIQEEDIQVVYPPAVERIIRPTNKAMQEVVSIGAFSPDKDQLAQIRIAEQLPCFRFKIVGSIWFTRYYQRCQEYILRKGVRNVELLPNLPRDQVASILNSAGLFLHTKVNEHFGISTVEAIARGCIPIVHDSGGQREVVPLKQCRFKTLNEAVAKLQIASQLTDREKLIAKLQEHVQKFTIAQFRQDMDHIFVSKITN